MQVDQVLLEKAKIGARNFAGRNFMVGQNVLILTDNETLVAGNLLLEAAEEVLETGRCVLLNLDKYTRPILAISKNEHLALIMGLESCETIIYIIVEQAGEAISLKGSIHEICDRKDKKFQPMPSLTVAMLAGF